MSKTLWYFNHNIVEINYLKLIFFKQQNHILHNIISQHWQWNHETTINHYLGPIFFTQNTNVDWIYIFFFLIEIITNCVWQNFAQVTADVLFVACAKFGAIRSMALCKNALTPLLTHWSYCSVALSHLNEMAQFWMISIVKTELWGKEC